MPERSSSGLIDCHVHIGPSDTGELYYGTLTGEEWLGLADAAGIDRALAFPPLRETGYAQANLDLAAWCAGTNGRVRALARIGGKRIGLTERRVWLLRRKLRRAIGRRSPDLAPDDLPRFAGIKLLPHLDGLPDKTMFEAANALGLPVLTHAGRFVPAAWLERAVLPLIKTKLVIAHLGAFPDREGELRQAVDLAGRDPRVFLDTSGIWIADFLRFALDRVPYKLIFGSDCPLTHPRVAWRFLETQARDDHLLERIGRESALEVFGPFEATRRAAA